MQIVASATRRDDFQIYEKLFDPLAISVSGETILARKVGRDGTFTDAWR